MSKSVKEIKTDILNISLWLNGVIEDEKIDGDAKKELAGIATELYYVGSTRKSLVDKKEYKTDIQKEVAEKDALGNACKGAANEIEIVSERFQIEGREGEILEDIASELYGVAKEIEARPKVKGMKTLDQFFEKTEKTKGPRVTTLDEWGSGGSK